ncbi:CAF17-like 4Fe-4S cluster assembly/insertion protein YgfZ [Kiloniella majae]|uniref:CAF17-like 4Fe-4S cluster assembly/insertion protein YgfZ n=1 Tax=Kiloniella majae TaxID=1938558 RepID=UPI000A278F88|nr:folate-binding protein YgfZ [Kiloniella majae]
MSDIVAVKLEHRTILKLDGDELIPFLQAVVTQDISQVTSTKSVWSALLTPQGKFLHEFFVTSSPDGGLFLDCEKERAADLLKRLKLYKMRSKATLEQTNGQYTILALQGRDLSKQFDIPYEKGISKEVLSGCIYIDPRHQAIGARAIIPTENLAGFIEEHSITEGTLEDYDQARVALGVPDGSRDLEIEKSILLENGFNELGAIDWDKGCYIGQELTARTKYRALIKKRLVPVTLTGSLPAIGSDITNTGKNVGVLRSLYGNQGLATLKIDALGSDQLLCGDATVAPQLPDWIEITS